MVQWRMPSLRPLHCLSPQLKQGLDRRCRATATGEVRKKLMGALEHPVFRDNASVATLLKKGRRAVELKECIVEGVKQHHVRAGCWHAEEASDTELGAADLEQWQLCQAKLAQLGFEEEECDTVLKKAFGWAGQAYWRKSKVKEVPTEQQVSQRFMALLCSPGAIGADPYHNCMLPGN